jgi:hypothetical protein
VREYLQERIESLDSRLKWFSENIDTLEGVAIENSKIPIDKLEKGAPPETIVLSQKLYKMMPRIKLPDLLLEVSKWTGFDRNFIHASIGHMAKCEEKTILMAALIAMATNIGYDVLRMTHSIREGNVTGSLIMGKIGSYSRQNALATSLREMGRIEKTIFILDYITNKSLRRRIQRELNKGEAMNAFARAIFFGKRGEFRERELQDQLQRASALNILINAISIWNTTYLQKAIEHLKQT